MNSDGPYTHWASASRRSPFAPRASMSRMVSLLRWPPMHASASLSRPFISGGFHAYYRHGGEPRRVRPNPHQPIDLLGDGMVVLPRNYGRMGLPASCQLVPSRGVLRRYEIVHGHIDDLAALTPLRHDKATDRVLRIGPDPELVTKGARGDTLWRHCMRAAHHCDDLEAL